MNAEVQDYLELKASILMRRKRSILKICLVAAGVILLVVIGRAIVVRKLQGLGILPAEELSKEEVRQLLRTVQLPESLSPKAVHALFDEGDGCYSLCARISVKAAQADEFLGAWLQEASRVSSDPQYSRDSGMIWLTYEIKMNLSLLPLRDDDILAFKGIKGRFEVQYLLRKRDAGVDIHCFLWNVPTSCIAEETQVIMSKGQRFGLGPGGTGKRRFGEFESD